jgi:hypothetical protein
MADNDTSKIRYDDFISSVQPDPAKPESTIMLSGFVGHGPEGHARVYPDPTLGTWYDIPEGDILHSIPVAESKLGGSHIWVRASAQIKPGSAPGGTGGGAEEALAAAAQPAAGIALQPTPATHCFICPPHTQNCTPATICTLHGHCPPAGAAPAAMPHTVATVCTQVLCTQGLATFCGCTPGIDCNAPPGNVQTQAPICTQGFPTFCGCTPGIDCMGLAAQAAPQQANTGVTVCFTDCVPPGNQMMKAAVGVNPMDPTPATRCFVCDPPQMAAAMQPTPTVQTHCFVCPPHTLAVQCWTNPMICGVLPPSFGCTQHGCQQGGGHPQLEAMAAPQAQAGAFEGATVVCSQPARCTQACMPQAQHGGGVTAATVCTMPPACPPHTQAVHCWTAPVVCDTMQMPTPATRCFICPPPNQDQTFATVCTQFACPTHPVVCNLQPTQPVVCGVLPPSFGCTQQGCQQGGGHPQFEAMAAPAHPNTAATLCTQQPACPPHTVHNSICICPTPSAVNQCGGPAHPTPATVCTQQPACPPHTIHNSMCICPTPSAVHQCGGQTPFTPTIPQFTLVGACPTFGVCPSVACGFTPVQNGVFTPFGR